MWPIGDPARRPGGVGSTAPASSTDANTAAPVSDFTATINWGNGGAQTGGTVSGSGGSFKVDGSHTYGGTGPFTVKVHILDEGGSTADATATILIYGLSAGGTFVIGNGRSAVGAKVTFWSAQWSTANKLSGGSAPADFKGFAKTPSTLPACGDGVEDRPRQQLGPAQHDPRLHGRGRLQLDQRVRLDHQRQQHTGDRRQDQRRLRSQFRSRGHRYGRRGHLLTQRWLVG